MKHGHGVRCVVLLMALGLTSLPLMSQCVSATMATEIDLSPRRGASAPRPLSREETIEIAVGRADAIVEGFVEGWKDTLLPEGYAQTWVRIRVHAKLKGPLGLGPGSILKVRVGEEGTARNRLVEFMRHEDAALLYLNRWPPEEPWLRRFPWGVPWSADGFHNMPDLWLGSPEGRRHRDRAAYHAGRQSRKHLARSADLIVVGRVVAGEPVGDLLAVDSVLAGRVRGDRISLVTRGFNPPDSTAICFLKRGARGRYTVVGKTGGFLQPPNGVDRAGWFAYTTRMIRELRLTPSS